DALGRADRGAGPRTRAARRRDVAGGQARGNDRAPGGAESALRHDRRRPPLPARAGPDRRGARQRGGDRPRTGAVTSSRRLAQGQQAGRNRMKRTIAGAFVALLVAAACGGGPGAGPSTETVKLTDGKLVIAVINDQSGVYADLSGKNAVEAVKMAVEDFKAKYGENALGGSVE